MNDTWTIVPPEGEYFPPKPLVREQESNPVISAIISLVAYALFGLLIFGGSVFSVVALIVVLFIHESGHLLAMWMYGYRKLRMLFIPLMGAVASGSKQDISDKEESVILLAGPLPGVLIGCVMLYFMNARVELLQDFDPVSNILFNMGRWFVILNVLNLLPFFPLDGGQLFRALFFRSGFMAYFIFAAVSFGLLLLLFMNNWSMLLILVLIFGRPLYSQYRAQGYYKALAAVGVDHRKTYDELSDRDFWLMRDALPQYSNTYAYIVPGQFRQFADANAQEVHAVRSLLERRYHSELGPAGKAVMIFLWLAGLSGVFVAHFIAPGSMEFLKSFGL